ncbi:MAG: aspartate 1-decarboxylase [Candidatus Aminicenantales bacterium]
MRRIILKGKIHRARVTEVNRDYEGSLTVDENLMNAAEMIPFEQVHVYNITNGERFLTYLIKGEKDSGVVGVNGAAAHKAKVGDEIIIATYVELEESEIDFIIPKIVILDADNRIKEVNSSG